MTSVGAGAGAGTRAWAWALACLAKAQRLTCESSHGGKAMML